MPGGRPLQPLELTDDESQQLQAWARRRKTAQALALRSRIVLRCAKGQPNHAVAKSLSVTPATVSKWRRRFVDQRIEGLADAPRSGKPRTVLDQDVYDLVTKTLEQKPADATHWSTRSMAAASGLSQSSVSRIWRAFGLQPHRTKTFKLSTDPHFVEKVRDVVGLYMNPPDRALVLCIDEKSQIQALDRSQPNLPMRPNSPEKHCPDYRRHGTTSLFAALDVATGRVIGRCHARHRHQEFLTFLKLIDKTVNQSYHKDIQVHLVMDNYATHKTPAIQKWLAARPRYHVHFTPTSASWLNQVERFFAEITEKCIRRGVFKSVAAVRRAIESYLKANNENPRPFKWTADADLILGKVQRVCRRILDSGH